MTTNNLPKINDRFRPTILKEFKEQLMTQKGMTDEQAEMRINELENARPQFAIKGIIQFNQMTHPQPDRFNPNQLQNVVDLTSASPVVIEESAASPEEQQMVDNAILNRNAYAGKDNQTHVAIRSVYDTQAPEYANKTIRIVDKKMNRALWPSDLEGDLAQNQWVVIYYRLDGFMSKRSGSWVESIRPVMLQVEDLDNIKYYSMGGTLPSVGTGLPKAVTPQTTSNNQNPYGQFQGNNQVPQGNNQMASGNNFNGAPAQGFNQQAPMSNDNSSMSGFPQSSAPQGGTQGGFSNNDYSSAPLEDEGENPFGGDSQAF